MGLSPGALRSMTPWEFACAVAGWARSQGAKPGRDPADQARLDALADLMPTTLTD